MVHGRRSLQEELQIKRYADLNEPCFKVLKKHLESGRKEDEKWAIEQLTKAFVKMIPQALGWRRGRGSDTTIQVKLISYGVILPYQYQCRPYQIPLLRAIDSGIKRLVAIRHRRAGKITMSSKPNFRNYFATCFRSSCQLLNRRRTKFRHYIFSRPSSCCALTSAIRNLGSAFACLTVVSNSCIASSFCPARASASPRAKCVRGSLPPNLTASRPSATASSRFFTRKKCPERTA